MASAWVSCIESICILWLSKKHSVHSRWINVLMNVFILFAEDDEVQIVEVRE